MNIAELHEFSEDISMRFKRHIHGTRLAIVERAEAAEAALAEKDKEIAALREALEAMLEPFEDDPCMHDHHGYCQAHFLQEDCCVAKARSSVGDGQQAEKTQQKQQNPVFIE